ncbi:MAG: phosphatase PAP2 family protein [Candidatus Marinimicrobia bacterium]|nr:phosphatase PAP2 family protein [Candidatus Neomarinimicrobiota bacterium]
MVAFICLGQNVKAQTNPTQRDWFIAGSGLGVAVGLELFGKDHLLPDRPRWINTNSVDGLMRGFIYKDVKRQELAERWSDRLLYGVSMSSLLWGPALADEHESAALINTEVFAVNSIITNLIKITTARERPYSHFGTTASRGTVDYASFVSGHSSVAFSQAVSNAIILSKYHPQNKELIWSSLLSIAGCTAYLRVAGDMHYFSDVTVGAALGSIIAWVITKNELKRFQDDSGSNIDFTLSLKIPLG